MKACDQYDRQMVCSGGIKMGLKPFVSSLVKRTFYRFGIFALSPWQYHEYMSQRHQLLKMLSESSTRKIDESLLAEGLIFSFNRPVQLHALLTSYFEKVQNPVPLYVQYGAKGEAFEAAYEDVKSEFEGKGVTFIKEANFKEDLLTLLDSLKARKIFFLVDDIIFINDVDMKDFCSFDPKQVMPNLRMNPDMDFSYTRQEKTLPPSNFVELEGEKLQFKWGDASGEWNYPMSVDGHLFDTNEIIAISKCTSYKAPNTYEGALMQFYDYVKDRPAVCYTESKLFNNPCNKVQTENDNVSGDISPESLLKRWNEGECIDVSTLYGFKNTAPHQEVAFTFKQR